MIISKLAAVLIDEGADLTDEADCVLALIAREGRSYSAREAALHLAEAVALARLSPRKASPSQRSASH